MVVIGEKIREDVVVDLFNKTVTVRICQAGKFSPSPSRYRPFLSAGGELSNTGSSRLAGITERLPLSV